MHVRQDHTNLISVEECRQWLKRLFPTGFGCDLPTANLGTANYSRDAKTGARLPRRIELMKQCGGGFVRFKQSMNRSSATRSRRRLIVHIKSRFERHHHWTPLDEP